MNFSGSLGRKIQANAEVDSDAPVDPPKVEEKIGAVPNGLSTDSDVVKRFAVLYSIALLCLLHVNAGSLSIWRK